MANLRKSKILVESKFLAVRSRDPEDLHVRNNAGKPFHRPCNPGRWEGLHQLAGRGQRNNPEDVVQDVFGWSISAHLHRSVASRIWGERGPKQTSSVDECFLDVQVHWNNKLTDKIKNALSYFFCWFQPPGCGSVQKDPQWRCTVSSTSSQTLSKASTGGLRQHISCNLSA